MSCSGDFPAGDTAGNLLVDDGDSFESVTPGGDVTMDATGDFTVVAISGSGTVELTGDLHVGGTGSGCIMMRDSDDGGWTVVTALNGTLSSTIDLDGLCN